MSLLKKIVNWYFTKNALPYWGVMALDCVVCYLSGILVFWFYYRGAVTLGNIVILSKTIFLYMVFNLVGFRVFKTYSGIIRYSSFVDLTRVGCAMALSCAIAEVMHYVVYGWNLNFVRLEGRQIFLMYVIATIVMWGMRVLVKSVYDVAFSSDKGMRTFVYGAQGDGVGLAKSIRNEKPTRFRLKGFLAVDSRLDGRIVMGVKVHAATGDVAALLRSMRVQAVLVSPLMNDRFRDDTLLQDALIEAGIRIFMTTEAGEWRHGDDLSKAPLHEVSVSDLLPREQIQVDMEAIGRQLAGKTVMVTGSAGSIGSEMVRQVAAFRPACMVLVDQAETPQHDIRLMMARDFPGIRAETIVASITSHDRMESLFRQYRPAYVLHAAAYKHVPMMEDNPCEAVINNVKGTKVIADLSVKYGVGKFVMVSTDKAVNPTNVMGCSKRICEIYVQSLNNALARAAARGTLPSAMVATQFVTTRFGNVLGSNGSVIPLFERQIKAGGPVTVTDPRIIRFFMLIPEACRLVLEAGTHGKGGEIFVFDMGKPVRIADLAKRMIRLSGAQGVEIRYTGLRVGEKLYEEMLSNTEDTLPSFHEKIRIARVRAYDYEKVAEDIGQLIALAHTFDDMATVGKMKEMVPEYVSNNSVWSVLDRPQER